MTQVIEEIQIFIKEECFMAFKSVREIKAQRNAGKFILENDGDTAFVIFLYRSQDEMLSGPTHYIKSNEYSGYVHCLEDNCPACAKGLRIQTKMFVPMFVLSINDQPVNEIQFWDRTLKFEPVLSQAVFKNYPNPSGYIFKITRIGAHGSKDTRYNIMTVQVNDASFDQIMSDNNATFPDFYEMVCKSVDAATMDMWLASAAAANVASNTNSNIPAYVATPRVPVSTPALPNVLDEGVDVPADDDDVPFDVDFGADE